MKPRLPCLLDFAFRSPCLAADVVTIPILGKDFIIDEKQIYQARLKGADACLLIVRCLDKIRLQTLIQCVESLNMTALVEVFDEKETETALACPGCLGAHNRFWDFQVSQNRIASLGGYSLERHGSLSSRLRRKLCILLRHLAPVCLYG